MCVCAGGEGLELPAGLTIQTLRMPLSAACGDICRGGGKGKGGGGLDAV